MKYEEILRIGNVTILVNPLCNSMRHRLRSTIYTFHRLAVSSFNNAAINFENMSYRSVLTSADTVT